jgi:hypothetical protein
MASFLAVAALMVVVGCGGSGEFPVEGTATYNGQPIPIGSITLEPVAGSPQELPTGFAVIRDGHFRSDAEHGCSAGKHVAVVTGYDGKPTAEQQALADEVIHTDDMPIVATGTPLFRPYKVEVDISGPGDELEIDVPAGATGG